MRKLSSRMCRKSEIIIVPEHTVSNSHCSNATPWTLIAQPRLFISYFLCPQNASKHLNQTRAFHLAQCSWLQLS